MRDSSESSTDPAFGVTCAKSVLGGHGSFESVLCGRVQGPRDAVRVSPPPDGMSGSGGLGSGCCALKESIQPRQPGWRLGPFRVFVTLWKPRPLFPQGSLKCAKFSCARKMANQGALQGAADGNDCPFPEARTTGCVLAAWGAGTAEHHGLHLLGNRCWSRGHPRLGQLVGAEC